MAYKGSVELISGITQKNNGDFPLVDASAVRVTDEKRLDEVLLNDAEDWEFKMEDGTTVVKRVVVSSA